jgi:hypothetical protein
MDGMTRLRAAAADRQMPRVPEISHHERSHIPMMTDPEYCWGCGDQRILWIDCPVRWRQ